MMITAVLMVIIMSNMNVILNDNAGHGRVITALR